MDTSRYRSRRGVTEYSAHRSSHGTVTLRWDEQIASAAREYSAQRFYASGDDGGAYCEVIYDYLVSRGTDTRVNDVHGLPDERYQPITSDELTEIAHG